MVICLVLSVEIDCMLVCCNIPSDDDCIHRRCDFHCNHHYDGNARGRTEKGRDYNRIVMGCQTSVGSALGGFAIGWVGINWCFVIDSFTYLISGMFLFAIRGEYRVAAPATAEGHQSDDDTTKESTTSSFLTAEQGSDENDSTSNKKEDEGSSDDEGEATIFWMKQIAIMTKDGFIYIKSQPWRSLIFIKLFACFIYGAGDVLNVSFAEHDGSEGSSKRLGIIFASVGIGCLIGPLVADPFARMDNTTSLEMMCLASFLCMGIGWLGLSWYIDFALVCVFSAVRAAGSTIAWIYTTLLLQKFSDDDMLGRVMGIDLALAALGKASSAMLAGILQDNAGLSAEQVSLVMAVTAFVMTVLWSIDFYFMRE